ncbi:hypothetical protein [Neotabrizicola sp. sgz301269]|uniref:hypothetical protein n=1 Tax=Neotabrizicola sp. sgz301269 TaxID=3276282 RepID=UPI00377016C2
MTTPLLRPEVSALMRRWAEPALGLGLAALGLWIATRGGWLLPVFGLPLVALGGGFALIALRRMRFAAGIAAPGIVELDEGRIRYLHPTMPGEVSLPDLTEIKLLALRGRRVWRLREAGGRGMLVPVDAAGAEGLFDAFATLPGLTSADLVAALAPDVPVAAGTTLPAPIGQTERLVWRRKGRGLTTV